MIKSFAKLSFILWTSVSVANQNALYLTQNIQIKNFINHTTSISCDNLGINCIAVGIDKHNQEHVAYVTHDGGTNWSEPTAFAPFESQNVNVEKYTSVEVSCDELAMSCTAVRLGFVDKIPRPIIYTTHDGGLSWSAPIMLNPPLSSKESKILSDTHNELVASNIKISCSLSGLACTLIGSVYSAKAMFPFIYSTQNGGQNWSLVKSLEEPFHSAPPSSGFYGTFLKDVACDQTGMKCKAVGFTMARNSILNSFYASLPVLYISNNGGKTWDDPIILPTKMDSNHADLLTNVSCSTSGKYCTTIGLTYHMNTDRSQVFSFTSQDAGHTWNKKVLVPSNELAEIPSSLTCDGQGNHCIAVGSYQEYRSNFTVSKPVYYVSSNDNKVWEKFNGTFSIPTSFEDVACDASLTSCIVVGSSFTLTTNTALKQLTNIRCHGMPKSITK